MMPDAPPEAARTAEDIHRAFAELIRAQDDPDVQDAMLLALRYPVARLVAAHLQDLYAIDDT
jgi:hypothetical protein